MKQSTTERKALDLPQTGRSLHQVLTITITDLDFGDDDIQWNSTNTKVAETSEDLSE